MSGLKIKKGDTVVVQTGKDRGKKGEVIRVLPAKSMVVVSGANKVKRHQAPKQGNPGGVIEKESPLHVSNVMFVDPKTGGPTKIGYKFLDDGTKVRVAKKSGEVIS